LEQGAPLSLSELAAATKVMKGRIGLQGKNRSLVFRRKIS
jgi:hypothetical protein